MAGYESISNQWAEESFTEQLISGTETLIATTQRSAEEASDTAAAALKQLAGHGHLLENINDSARELARAADKYSHTVGEKYAHYIDLFCRIKDKAASISDISERTESTHNEVSETERELLREERQCKLLQDDLRINLEPPYKELLIKREVARRPQDAADQSRSSSQTINFTENKRTADVNNNIQNIDYELEQMRDNVIEPQHLRIATSEARANELRGRLLVLVKDIDTMRTQLVSEAEECLNLLNQATAAQDELLDLAHLSPSMVVLPQLANVERSLRQTEHNIVPYLEVISQAAPGRDQLDVNVQREEQICQ